MMASESALDYVRARTSAADESPLPAPPLPLEIIVHIFGFVVRSEGPVPFLPRVARVCRTWAISARDATLWATVDLSKIVITNALVKRYAQSGVWRLLESIDFSGQKKLNDASVAAIAKYCPRLKHIALAHCAHLSKEAVKSLSAHARALESIDLSATPADACSNNILISTLYKTHASTLRRLTLDHADNVSRSHVASIIDSLHALTHLSLVGVSVGHLPVTPLQRGCPLLEHLDLGFSVTTVTAGQIPRTAVSRLDARSDDHAVSSQGLERDPDETGVGFPRLRWLSVARVDISDNGLYALAGRSPLLKYLDIRECKVTCFSFAYFAATSLEELFAGRSNFPGSHLRTFGMSGVSLCARLWGHTLKGLDLSYWLETESSTAEAMRALSSSCARLEWVNLAGSGVDEEGLRLLVNGSSSTTLKAVSVAACRRLSRGIRVLATEPAAGGIAWTRVDDIRRQL